VGGIAQSWWRREIGIGEPRITSGLILGVEELVILYLEPLLNLESS
jgi:hypothetical protein